MKTLLKIIIATVLLLNVVSLLSQEHVTANVSFDTKLMFFGDDKGNDPLTVNYNIRSEWQGKQKETSLLGINTSGYLFIAPEFEYADLQGGIYRRYSANVGYSFNKWVENVIFTTSVGYGIIDYNGGWRGFGSNFQIAYEVVKGVYFFLDAEFVDRLDLAIYNDRKWRMSGKAGAKVDLK